MAHAGTELGVAGGTECLQWPASHAGGGSLERAHQPRCQRFVASTSLEPSGPGTIEVLSLVDSAADRILIPASVARQLGIVLDGVPDEPLGGLGGSATARFVPTQLEWQGLQWTTHVGFTDAVG